MTQPDSPRPFRIYFAGELFDSKDLIGNAIFAELIYERSQGRYVSVLPQNLEQRETTAQAIRDNDLYALFSCDLGLFHFDGTELDSGTVVEFMAAKFADIPSVVLRTDMRKAGDAGDIPWNLMASHYPRTLLHVVDLTGRYNVRLRASAPAEPAEYLAGGHSRRVAEEVLAELADEVITLLDQVRAQTPVLKKEEAPAVYDWIARMVGFGEGDATAREKLKDFLQAKQEAGIL
jgi:hypothetical protein